MLSVVIVISMVIVASTYVAVLTESKTLRANLIQKGQNTARNIASSTKSAFWSLNWIFVENLLRDSANSEQADIVFTKIVKPNGEVYLANDQKYYGKQVDPQLLTLEQSLKTDFQFTEEGVLDGILLVHPVSIGKDTWHILLGMSTDPIQKSIQGLIEKNIKWGCLFILIAAGISLLISNSISKPIVNLANASRIIADGSREQFINVNTRDEVGRLGNSFNRMIDSIRQAENALLDSNDRLVAVLNSIDATVYVADLETYEIQFMNLTMKEAFGDNYEGKLCYQVFRGLDHPCDHCRNRELLDQHGQPTGMIMWESKNPLVNRWYANHDRVIKWIDGRMVHLQIAFDITHSKELEQQRREAEFKLRQSQKMEAIGKLAGGVAHDLNNVLSGIINYPELMLMDLPANHEMREPLKSIQDSGERAAKIVNDLLTLARRGVPVSDVIDLNTVVKTYLSSPEYKKLLSFNPMTRVELDLATDLKMMKGSPIHLSKMLMNLVSNASEAMPNGGRILISTRNTAPVEADWKGNSNPSPQINLSISDEGVGITHEEQEKIFEPFYTKKVMGRSGTGLGMAVVWGTVEDHFGRIEIESELEKGTTFSIYFPSTEEKPEGDADTIDLSTLKAKGEHILVVDDVKEQRDLATKMLERLGYRVNAVSGGEAAIEYLQKSDADLMLLDMIMDPGINGLQTYERVIAFKPGQKAVIASGYSESDDVKRTMQLGAGRYIHKPYRFETLAEAVRGELDGITMSET